MSVSTMQAKSSVNKTLVSESMKILSQAVKAAGCDKTLIAYSGGKDGLVCALLAKDIGVNTGVCETSFYFTEQERNIRDTAAALGFNIVYKNSLDLKWLAERPKYVFSHDAGDINMFCEYRQRRSFEGHAARHGYKAVITGRKKDGNCVKSALYQKKNGLICCHPLREWRDEDIWAYLSYRGVDRPWIYGTPFGQREGNSFWPCCRVYPDRAGNYDVIYSMEPKIIEEAAIYGVFGARDYLREVKNGRDYKTNANNCFNYKGRTIT